MIAKTFEVRDAATFIPMLAVKLEPSCEADRYLLARAGYGREPSSQAGYIMLWDLNGGSGQAEVDPYKHTNRTRKVAHQFLLTDFDVLESGAVIDVEYILGVRAEPKISEAQATR